MSRYEFWTEAYGMLDIFEAADKDGIITVPNDTPGVCAECSAWWDTPGDEWPPEKADYVCPNDCSSYEWYAAESSRLRAAAPWWNPILFTDERTTRASRADHSRRLPRTLRPPERPSASGGSVETCAATNGRRQVGAQRTTSTRSDKGWLMTGDHDCLGQAASERQERSCLWPHAKP
jgi:hypothetical protein